MVNLPPGGYISDPNFDENQVVGNLCFVKWTKPPLTVVFALEMIIIQKPLHL